MQVHFHKYQGAANDFILIDDRSGRLQPLLSQAKIEQLCHRRLGIGADGLILLQSQPDADFKMVYYNSDGRESSLCGNGGRCVVAFGKKLGIIGNQTRFLAVDGLHEAHFQSDLVALQMQDVRSWQQQDGDFILNTGSPHYVRFVDNLDEIDVYQSGKAIRYSPAFAQEGINVNFVSAQPDGLHIATYERGVEAETWACGTGATAAALSAYLHHGGASPALLHTKGGLLKVEFNPEAGAFSQIYLIGGAEWVFEGSFQL